MSIGKRSLRLGLLAGLALSIPQDAFAEEISLDALAPGNIVNCSSPISGLYGNTFVAGSNSTISKLEFVVDSASTPPANAVRVRVSTGAPMSTTGTLVGTFSQSAVAASASDGAGKYLMTFTGSANVTQGTTYYVQPSYVSSNTGQGLCLSGSAYTAASGWSLPKSGSDYIDVWSTGTFNWASYHKFRITTGALITAATVTSMQLAGNQTRATFGTPINLTANIAAPARVTFYLNNKRIPKCIGLLTSGTAPNISVTCSWKPTLKGAVQLTAKAVPIDSALSTVVSSPLAVSISSRATFR